MNNNAQTNGNTSPIVIPRLRIEPSCPGRGFTNATPFRGIGVAFAFPKIDRENLGTLMKATRMKVRWLLLRQPSLFFAIVRYGFGESCTNLPRSTSSGFRRLRRGKGTSCERWICRGGSGIQTDRHFPHCRSLPQTRATWTSGSD